MIGPFEKRVVRIGNWGTAIGCVLMISIAGIVVATVVGRAFRMAIPGTFDLVETLMVVPIAFALVFGQTEDSHLSAGIVAERVRGRTREAIKSLTGILNLVYWAVLLFAAATMMKDKWEGGETTDILNVPLILFRGIWVFALILMVILLLFKVMGHAKKVIKGEGKK